MHETKVAKPGKLYLMGEYGVVSGQSDALILTTKVRLSVSVCDHPNFQIDSSQWPRVIPFSFHDNRVVWPKNEPWTKAVNLVFRYLFETQKPGWPVAIKVQSELDQDASHKWGLGSSGALAVALIEALLTHYGHSFSSLDWFRLAVLAEIEDATLTSFGDFAASSFATTIRYHMPNRAWLQKHQNDSIASLLGQTWPELVIEPLTLPNLPLLVVHSKEAASSHQLVNRVFSSPCKTEIGKLLAQIGAVVSNALSAWQAYDVSALRLAVRNHQSLILKLDQVTNAGIQTDRLRDLEAIGETCGTACKYSGAGGGDNLLFCYANETEKTLLIRSLDHQYPLIQSLIEGVRP